VSDTVSDTSTPADPPPLSPLTAVADEYVDRTADEVQILERQFKGGGYGGLPYIAPPAPGHDTKGLWHYFPAHTRQGYAAHAIAFHKMLLDEMKVPTSLVPHRYAALDIEQFPKDRADMLTKWMADAVGLPEAVIVSLPPDVGMYDMTRALVNYVAGPECTEVSAHTAELVNSEKLTALWCVSPFAARAYLNGGVRPAKVHVVRPAICDGIWRDMFTPLTALTPPSRSTFVFGTLGTWHERKGFHDLLRAYFASFTRSDDVELHLRTSSLDSKLSIKKFEEKVIAEIADIAKEYGDTGFPASKKQPRIKLLTGTSLTEQEVISWLGSLDCFVNPSYGEGLGIPQMWALAQGVRLVTSDFGAVGEFATSVLDVPTFKSRLVQVPASMRGHSSAWGEKSMWGGYAVKDLAASMLEASKRRDRDRDAAQTTRSHFSYKATRPGAEKALAQLCRPEIFAGWGLKAP
jgi:glycosyltransferase involved in cell wall biosynthesis